ncbi:hypothetical protein [Bifidobacterium stellenboschense]|uniref:Uncharacterized protein n=1 Tax=Bifidobacterium stellenboschense TaxID=762211 RepID=A0A087DJN1_9BIFI|nr:hypothetical protein [Bifidobacterium stellenboschense]KFI95731.1 hypothetical protein BSTEL_0537 [Bifidobacterium stellenboschense]
MNNQHDMKNDERDKKGGKPVAKTPAPRPAKAPAPRKGCSPRTVYFGGGLVNDLQEFPEDVWADPADPMFDWC